MRTRLKRRLAAAVFALALALPAGPALAHVPPDTGPNNEGGQTGCVADSHDPAVVASSAPDNTCGTR